MAKKKDNKYRMTASQKEAIMKYQRGVRRLRKRLKNLSIYGKESVRKAGANSIRKEPDLILPRSNIRTNKVFETKEDYQKAIKRLQKLQDFDSYIRNSYKKNLLNLWREKISDVSYQLYDTNIEPDARGGKTYSREQEQYFSELSEYMKMYNKFERMSSSKFMELYYSGYIVPYKEIYNELNQVEGRQKVTDSFLDKQTDLLSTLDKISMAKPSK